jgi:phospholipid/cholesterol/gamma-HCH transport system substrate-binding protein
MAYILAHDTAAANDVRRTMANLEKSSGTLEENLRALQRNFLFRKYFREKEREERREERRR